MTARSPYDGLPYYCAVCGMGLGEVMACEEPDCEMETTEAAAARRLAHRMEVENNDRSGKRG